MKCKYCQKELKNKSGLKNHEINCIKTYHMKPLIIDMYIKEELTIIK